MPHFYPYMVLFDMKNVHTHAVSVQPESFNSAPRLPFLLLLTHLLPTLQSRCRPSLSCLTFSLLWLCMRLHFSLVFRRVCPGLIELTRFSGSCQCLSGGC